MVAAGPMPPQGHRVAGEDAPARCHRHPQPLKRRAAVRGTRVSGATEGLSQSPGWLPGSGQPPDAADVAPVGSTDAAREPWLQRPFGSMLPPPSSRAPRAGAGGSVLHRPFGSLSQPASGRGLTARGVVAGLAWLPPAGRVAGSQAPFGSMLHLPSSQDPPLCGAAAAGAAPRGARNAAAQTAAKMRRERCMGTPPREALSAAARTAGGTPLTIQGAGRAVEDAAPRCFKEHRLAVLTPHLPQARARRIVCRNRSAREATWRWR
jgi:hypothetical protein